MARRERSPGAVPSHDPTQSLGFRAEAARRPGAPGSLHAAATDARGRRWRGRILPRSDRSSRRTTRGLIRRWGTPPAPTPAATAAREPRILPSAARGWWRRARRAMATAPPAAPTSSPERRTLQRTAGACTAECVNATVITGCTNNDGCCASGCNNLRDSDCACQCGNAVTEPACETCDGTNCPSSCPAIGCQLRTLQGMASTCNAECVNSTTITACANDDACCAPGCNAKNDNNCTPVCGNSVVESDESCGIPSRPARRNPIAASTTTATSSRPAPARWPTARSSAP